MPTQETWTPEQYKAHLAGASVGVKTVGHTKSPAPPTPTLALGLVAYVRSVAMRHGWLGYQHQDHFGDTELFLIRKGELLVVLCKDGRTKLTAEQAQWQSLLNSVPGIEAVAWWARDKEAIEARLTR